MNRQLFILLTAVTLDSIGIGLMFPILPALLRELTGSGEVSLLFGAILAVYALMQFIFSPILGALSDRFGRRPVLLVSLAGAAIDYLVMALAPVFWVLPVGRAIAGITGANMSVAGAYIADITPEADRARRFGLMSACFGIGFVIGPVVGGLLGSYWLRSPFLLAAALNGLNFLLALFVLPESRQRGPGEKFELATLNPLAPLRWAATLPVLLPLIAAFFVYGLVGNIPGTVWVLYGHDRFGWNALVVGLSLSLFGICHSGAQAFVVGRLTARFGEVRTLLIGIGFDSLAFILMGIATAPWVPFALAPLFALGGLGAPSLQALMSRQVDSTRQGELQGVMASVNSLTTIVGPIVGTGIYAATRLTASGTVWFVGVALYLLVVPILMSYRRRLAAA